VETNNQREGHIIGRLLSITTTYSLSDPFKPAANARHCAAPDTKGTHNDFNNCVSMPPGQFERTAIKSAKVRVSQKPSTLSYRPELDVDHDNDIIATSPTPT
jgi:hypothetical protein